MCKWLNLPEKQFSVGVFVGLLIGLILATTTIAAAEQPTGPQVINNGAMVPVNLATESLAYTPQKGLTATEWENNLNNVLNNKLPNILQDNSLSNYGKALKIAGLIQDNLSYSPPESLLPEHYFLIQYLFAKQTMFLALDSAESEIGNPVRFSQAKAIVDFNRGIADACLEQLDDYLK